MALDINPLSFIGDIWKSGKAQKWYRLLAGTTVAAFLGFWGTLGTVGGFVLAAHPQEVSLALVTGLFSGCVMMAASVALTIHKQKMWEELGVSVPKQLQEILDNTDVTGKKD